MMKFIFGRQKSIKVFYKLILSFWVCITRNAQSTQNSKFAISLQYLKENRKNEVDLLLAGKHQRFLEIDQVILEGGVTQREKNWDHIFLLAIPFLLMK